MFSDTSRNSSYDTNTGSLSAQCQTDDKQWRNSWLNINDCLLWQDPKIMPYKGPRETSEWNHSLVTSRADHERNTASFGGTTISLTHETEGNNRKEAKVNLDDYVRNDNGVLEFVSGDKEPAWF